MQYVSRMARRLGPMTAVLLAGALSFGFFHGGKTQEPVDPTPKITYGVPDFDAVDKFVMQAFKDSGYSGAIVNKYNRDRANKDIVLVPIKEGVEVVHGNNALGIVSIGPYGEPVDFRGYNRLRIYGFEPAETAKKATGTAKDWFAKATGLLPKRLEIAGVPCKVNGLADESEKAVMDKHFPKGFATYVHADLNCSGKAVLAGLVAKGNFKDKLQKGIQEGKITQVELGESPWTIELFDKTYTWAQYYEVK